MIRLTRLLALLAAFVAFLAAATPARAGAFIPPMPQDLDQVDVYLLTAGRGDQIYALFGHTILRVVDRKNRLDMNFNWGSFDFADKAFAWKFYIGDLRYFVDVLDFKGLVEGYGRYDHRYFVQDKLNLTAAQKGRLMRRIIDNVQPQNRYYQYQQVKDNCATKPRDVLDEAVGGGIRSIYAHRLGREPYRPYIRDGAREFWWADIGMDMLINSSYDAPISQWDEMFHPLKLRAHLLATPAFGDDGNPIAGKNLLEGTDMLVDLPEPFAKRDPYFTLGLIMVIPATLLWLWRAPFPAMNSARWVRAVGLAALLFGVWSGLFGSAMTFNWLASRYTETWANANLWLMWPLDFAFAVWGAKALATGRPFGEASLWSKLTRNLSRLHVAGILILAAASATALVQQNVTPILATTGLTGLLIYGLLARRVA